MELLYLSIYSPWGTVVSEMPAKSTRESNISWIPHMADEPYFDADNR